MKKIAAIFVGGYTRYAFAFDGFVASFGTETCSVLIIRCSVAFADVLELSYMMLTSQDNG